MKITCNEDHLKVIMKACEFMTRLYCGQVDELAEIKKEPSFFLPQQDKQIIKKMLFPELQDGAYYSIFTTEISDNARTLMDIYDTINFFLSWRKEDNTPENRDWSKQLGCNFDEPFHMNKKIDLIKVEE